MSAEEFEDLLDRADMVDELAWTAPDEARGLLHALVAWSRRYGFEPHRDYAAAEALFGDVVAAPGDRMFGKEGLPVFVPGPRDSGERIADINAKLRASLGDAVYATTAATSLEALAGALSAAVATKSSPRRAA
jgi:hypothetical protein